MKELKDFEEFLRKEVLRNKSQMSQGLGSLLMNQMKTILFY